jgi:hypothetical protein
LTESATIGQPAKLYIDDGTGFEPTFEGQGSEIVVAQAAGSERFLQLAKFPITPPMLLSTQVEPFNLVDGQELSIQVNDSTETITFTASDFQVPGQVRLYEVINAINAKATLVIARSIENRTKFALVARSVAGVDPDTLHVLDDDARVSLSLPSAPTRILSLYKNDELLYHSSQSAFVYSTSRSLWNFGTNVSVRLQIKVDDTPQQGVGGAITLTDADFVEFGVGFADATLDQWATVLNRNIAGVTVTVELTRLKVESNRQHSSAAKVEIFDDLAADNLASIMFDGAQVSTGVDSEYSFNRFSGQVELVDRLSTGDTVLAGTRYTRARIESAVVTGGLFNFAVLVDGTRPVIYLSADSSAVIRSIVQGVGTTYTISRISGSEIQVVTDRTDGFAAIEVGDYFLIVPKTSGWFSANTEIMGLFRVTQTIDDETIRLAAATSAFLSTAAAITNLADIQAFQCDGLIQSVDLTGQNLRSTDVADLLNANLQYMYASAKNTNQVRIESVNFNDTQSQLNLLAVTGSAANVWSTSIVSTSAQSHIGALTAQYGQATFPVWLTSGAGLFANTFSRGVLTGALTSNSSAPNPQVIDSTQTFTTRVHESDIVTMLTGLNNSYATSVRDIVSNTTLTIADFNSRALLTSDRYAISRSHSFGANDRLVVVLDGDDNNKTFNIPMYRSGRVAASPAPTVSAFSAYDADGLGTFDVATWNDFDFSDFNLMFRARNAYRPSNDPTGSMIIRSAMYGSVGEQISFTVAYPTAPSAPASIAHTVSQLETHVTVTLPSGVGILNISNVGAGFFLSKSSNVITLEYASVGSAPDFAGNGVLPGDVVVLSDPGFITKSVKFNDVGRVTSVSATALSISVSTADALAYQGVLTGAVSQSSTVLRYYSADTSMFTLGDKVSIDGFSKTANNLSNVEITAINPNVSIDVIGTNRSQVSNPGPLILSSASRTTNTVSLVFSTPVGTYIEPGDLIDVSNMDPIGLAGIEGTGLAVLTVVTNTVTYTLNGGDIPSTPVTAGFGTVVTAKNETAAATMTAIFTQTSGIGIQSFPLIAFTANDLKTLVTSSAVISRIISVVIAAGQSGDGAISRATYDEAVSTSYNHTPGDDRVWLYDGEFNVEAFVSIIGNTTHNFTLKSAMSFSHADYDITTVPNPDTVDVGELFRLTPTSFRNTTALLMKNAVTALSIFGRCDAIADNGRAQISSNTVGSAGGVMVAGGYGNRFESILKSQAVIDGTALRVEINASEMGSLRVGQVVQLQNNVASPKLRAFQANDEFDVIDETATTALITALPRAIALAPGDSLTITDVSATYGRTPGSGIVWRWTGPTNAWTGAKVGDTLFARNASMALNLTPDPSTDNGDYHFPTFMVVGVDDDYIDVHNPAGAAEVIASLATPLNIYVTPSFVTPYRTRATTATKLRVESLRSGAFAKLTWISGTAPLFAANGVTVDSYVRLVGTAFAISNRGTFRVVAVGSDHIVIENSRVVDEEVTLATAADIQFLDSESLIVGDTLSIADTTFNAANRGVHAILGVGFANVAHGMTTMWLNYARLSLTGAVAQESVALSGLPRTFFASDGSLYSTYRDIVQVAQSPINAENAYVYLLTSHNDHKLGDAYGTTLAPVTKFGFVEEIANQGMDGYRYFTGLLATVQKVVDGDDQDSTTYPGYRAAGTQVEVLPPLIKRVEIALVVKTKSGISLNVLSDAITSTVLHYLNTLGVGQDIIMSEVVSRVMQVEGVESVQLSTPDPTVERIIVEDEQKVIASIDDISVAGG